MAKRPSIRRVGKGVLLELVLAGTDARFAALLGFRCEPFMPYGRNQPKTPTCDVFP